MQKRWITKWLKCFAETASENITARPCGACGKRRNEEMKPVREYKPGERITIMERVEDERRKTKKQKKTLTVIKQYPHFVLAEDKMGNKRSITNAELYMMAMEQTKTEDGAPMVADASGRIIGRGKRK